jgi:hypothetical protein
VEDRIKEQGDQRVTRDNMPWDEGKISPGDVFEVHQRQRGGASPKKCRDPFSEKNHNPRMARRKRVKALVRALREKQKEEAELEESTRWKSTAVTYEEQEFITKAFVNDEWNKGTARRFARWVRGFSGFEMWNQRLIDMDTNVEFTEIRGKTLALLNSDEVWESGQVMLKRKPSQNGPWRGIQTSPIRVFLRKSISLFEEDHQGIRVQLGWLGISCPRSHMGETPSRKGWWRIYWNQKFIEQAGRIKKGLDYTKVKSPAEIVDWPVPEPFTTSVKLRYRNSEVKREFRRGFEGDRIIDWAEKTWGFTPEMNCITLNGVDWTPSNFIPQDGVIDFISRFQEQPMEAEVIEEESKSELTVFVNFLDQTRVWTLTKDFEWSSFKAKVDEVADDVKWHAVFGGAIWEDDSRTPEKNTTITVNLELPGGEPPRRIPSTHVWVF